MKKACQGDCGEHRVISLLNVRIGTAKSRHFRPTLEIHRAKGIMTGGASMSDSSAERWERGILLCPRKIFGSFGALEPVPKICTSMYTRRRW